jgi:hypothetical protein
VFPQREEEEVPVFHVEELIHLSLLLEQQKLLPEGKPIIRAAWFCLLFKQE